MSKIKKCTVSKYPKKIYICSRGKILIHGEIVKPNIDMFTATLSIFL